MNEAHMITFEVFAQAAPDVVLGLIAFGLAVGIGITLVLNGMLEYIIPKRKIITLKPESKPSPPIYEFITASGYTARVWYMNTLDFERVHPFNDSRSCMGFVILDDGSIMWSFWSIQFECKDSELYDIAKGTEAKQIKTLTRNFS